MSDERWPISWWDWTGEYTPFVDSRSSPYLKNMATGEVKVLDELPFGACYVANKDPKTGEIEKDSYWTGHDGLSIVCVTPRTAPADPSKSGQWYIDSMANNCTKKDDKVHRCWVRHGTVGDPLHIDKSGNTCAAGAGSIQHAGWHGYLKNGVLSRDGR